MKSNDPQGLVGVESEVTCQVSSMIQYRKNSNSCGQSLERVKSAVKVGAPTISLLAILQALRICKLGVK